MSGRSGCLALTWSLLSCVVASASSSSSSSVLDLSPDNITSTAQQYKYMMLEFYAPWCGHCQALEPEYSKAAEEISAESKEVALARLDITLYPSVQEEYGIRSFPTLKWFEDGKVTSLQPNERQADKIVEWCRKHTSMTSDVDTIEGLRARIDKAKRFLAVGFFEDTDDKLYHAFQDVESRFIDKEFEIVKSPQVAEAMGVKMPAVRLYTKVEEDNSISETGREIVYSGSSDPDELAGEVIKASSPVLLRLGDENEEELYADDKVPKALIFRASSEDLEEFRSAAMVMRDRFNFVHVVNDTNKRICNWVGLQPGEESWVYVVRIDKSKRYRYEAAELNKEGITSFLHEYLNGKLQPYHISEKIYDNWNASTVKKIVGKQFREFVEQDRHVVVEFFAPWCRHCRALEPKYKLAAKYFETRFPDEFVFGQIDGSKNEVPGAQIQGFPTVWIYPKGKKEPPYPLDFTEEAKDPHQFVKNLRLATGKLKEEREFEDEYVRAAKRFKDAVRKLEGSLKPAVKELEEAAKRLEALA